MARTLSDTLIIAMIEAASRLTAGRGPIGPIGGGAAQGGAAATPPAGEAGSAGAMGAVSAEAPATGGGAGSSGAAGGSGAGAGAAAGGPGGERDPRTAEQIASDFRTIYSAMEEVVRTSAEQETKSGGFGIR